MKKTESSVVELLDTNFADEIERGVTLVDFWAPWCGPCRFIAPAIEQLADEYAGRATVAKLNVDEAPQTAAAYGIRSIPTIGIFKDGEPVEGVVGVVPKDQLARLLEGHLPANWELKN